MRKSDQGDGRRGATRRPGAARRRSPRRPASDGTGHRVGRPRKRFGQHFLIDRGVVRRIIAALQPTDESVVVEIGPGKGALTEALRATARRVIAIEVDRDLAAALRTRYHDDPGLTIIDADALRVDWAALAGTPFLLAGNLPYNITTPLLFKSLDPPRPERAVFLVQREVGQRLVAGPGSKAYGALTVNAGVAVRSEIVSRVPAGAFAPVPAVESVIVRFTPRREALLRPAETPGFRRFVQSVFGMRRKQLQRVLRELYHLDGSTATSLLAVLKLPAAARPEALSPEELVRLFRALPVAAGEA
jgi:16S rRNA (adenine1518-N6/adenine1519-N6)-dimethyltransferase